MVEGVVEKVEKKEGRGIWGMVIPVVFPEPVSLSWYGLRKSGRIEGGF